MKKKIVKKFAAATVFVLAAAVLACAGNRTTAAYLLINSYPAAAAFGEPAGAACGSIVYSGHSPASIASVENIEFAVMHNGAARGITAERLSVAKKFGFGSVGADISYYNLGVFTGIGVDASGGPVYTGQQSEPYALAGSLIYGRRAGNISFGAALRVIREDMGEGAVIRGSMDAGVMAANVRVRGLDFGLSVINASPEAEDGFYLPILVNGAVIYRLISEGAEVFRAGLGASWLPMEESLKVSLGFDLPVLGILNITGGAGVDNNANLSFSAGISVSFDGIKTSYAYLPSNAAGDSHRVSLSGGSFSPALQQISAGEAGAGIESYMESGDYYYNARQFRNAIKYYEYINLLYWKDLDAKSDREKSAFFQKLGISYYNIKDNSRAAQYFERALFFDRENEILKHWIRLIK
ncbi:MAG TPA: hypothetical protein ENN43_06410 [bacterium]|nr:hypothetical protein [bacterium]